MFIQLTNFDGVPVLRKKYYRRAGMWAFALGASMVGFLAMRDGNTVLFLLFAVAVFVTFIKTFSILGYGNALKEVVPGCFAEFVSEENNVLRISLDQLSLTFRKSEESLDIGDGYLVDLGTMTYRRIQ